jgi:phosphopantetheinyl transferase
VVQSLWQEVDPVGVVYEYADASVICELQNVYEARAVNRDPVRALARVALARLGGGEAGYQAQRRAARELMVWLAQRTLGGGAESFAVRATSAGPPGLLFRGQPLADVSVSLSHSADWIAAGLARGGRLGIDVERENPRRRIAAMADWMSWRDCHEADAFYGAWTYREARIKCSGEAPPSGAALLPPEVGVSAGRHHALRLRPMPGVHGCLLVETVTALSLSWSEVDADGLATWS